MEKLLVESSNAGAGTGKSMGRELVKVEVYMMPIRLELVREVIPLLGIVFSLGLLFGYLWAMKAYTSFS